jgi:hypothetical protein
VSYAFYTRATRWLCVPHVARRLALVAFLCTLPSLAMGLHADDYILREQVLERGPFAAYVFHPLDPQAAFARALEDRAVGRGPWWADEHARVRFFRPLSSLSLWLDFAHGAPVWWMHLENCAIYAGIVWLAVTLYRQLGLSGAGLGWAAVFFALDGAIATSVGWIAGSQHRAARGRCGWRPNACAVHVRSIAGRPWTHVLALGRTGTRALAAAAAR